MDRYTYVNGKKLRCGYTTGTCACAAAGYATRLLLTGNADDNAFSVETPSGVVVTLDIHDIVMGDNYASCAVIKDGGDDPDITTGMYIYARASLIPDGRGDVIIEGGEGIGVVTAPGLDQPVGNAAINSTPRKYISEIVGVIREANSCPDSIRIVVSAPEGVDIAKKTFNPRMGITGGISIIGTTGIVEPMSNTAIIETTRLELKQKWEKGDRSVYISPGRIGESFAGAYFGIDSDDIVLSSNNIAEAIEEAARLKFTHITLIGHIGKLVKLGYGARNTHSANNDGRIEELVLCALKAGADSKLLGEIASMVTTDAVVSTLERAGILGGAMEALGDRIEDTLHRWCGNSEISFCVFTNFNDTPRILIKRGM